MAFKAIQECELCEVMKIQIFSKEIIDNSFVPVVKLNKQKSEGFDYIESKVKVTLDSHITKDNPLPLEIVKFNGEKDRITLKFDVEKGNPKANDEKGNVTIKGIGVKVEPTEIKSIKYNSTFELNVSIEGMSKERNIQFTANDDDLIFDGRIKNVLCGKINVEGVKAAKGFYYASDGTLLGRIGQDKDPTDVMLVKDTTKMADAKNFIQAINKGEGKDLELMKLSSAVGMKNEELNTRAFMSTLKQAENGGNAPLPYNAWNGFSGGKPILFTKYEDHPGERTGGSAAGAYQIMKASWTDKWVGAEKFGIKDFSPKSQDKFIYLTIKYKLKAADIIAEGDIDKAITMTATEWRALPGPKTQSKLTIDKIKELFKNNIAKELSKQTDIETTRGELTKYEK